jgi:acetyl esterase/lipase
MITRTYSYKRIGTNGLLADVYHPDAASSPPVVVWLHGGGLIFGSRRDLAGVWVDHVQRYLTAGFAVVAIDYRLAPETKLDGIVKDLQDAHSWIRDVGRNLLGVDAERIAFVGHSAGGYLALTAGWLLRPRPTALVSFYGYGDITRPWYTRPSPHYSQEPAVSREAALAAVWHAPLSEPPSVNSRALFYLYCRQRGRWPNEVSGHDPEREPKWFDRFCPIRNIAHDYPATLLVHGDRDTDVPTDESMRMAEALALQGIPHELIVIPGGEHAFDVLQHDDPVVVSAAERATAFLRDRFEYGTKR